LRRDLLTRRMANLIIGGPQIPNTALVAMVKAMINAAQSGNCSQAMQEKREKVRWCLVPDFWAVSETLASGSAKVRFHL